jgi:cation diffusion facilitator family transporter
MDSVSSVIALFTDMLARKAPDAGHPHGYGRIEYIAAFVVAEMILIAGWELLQESVNRVITPEHPTLTMTGLAVMCASVLIKSVLCWVQTSTGKKWDNEILIAAGTEARIDIIQTIAAIICPMLAMKTGMNFDAWAGVAVSLLLIRNAVIILRSAVNSLLGTRGDTELSRRIYELLKEDPSVKDAYDLVMHSYGPLNQQGSVKIVIPDTMEVKELNKLEYSLEKKIRRETGITLLFSERPGAQEDEETFRIKKLCTEAAVSEPGTKEIRGFYYDRIRNEVRFDAITDYSVKNTRAYRKAVSERIKPYCKVAAVIIEVNREKNG